jgi:diguanylate cyclase (GGDEF)-like protein
MQIVEAVTVTEVKDALTGLRTGRTCQAMLDQLTEEIRQGQRDVAIALMDVNKTHQINQKYGRDKGDEYLKASSSLICYTFKHSPVFRYTGDEFLAVLKGADLEDREKRRDYLNREMANMQLARDEWKRLSIAVGIAVCREEDDSAEDMLNRARERMLEDKKSHEGL